MKQLQIRPSAPALAFLLTFLFIKPAYTQQYAQYCNVRFDYCIEYPANLLYPQGESDNSDGQNFLSRDKSILMKVWGSNNIFGESLQEHYQKELQNKKSNPSVTVTYRIFKNNFFTLSGYMGHFIFYQKTTLTNGTFKTLYFEYPAAKKMTLAQIVTRASLSFP